MFVLYFGIARTGGFKGPQSWGLPSNTLCSVTSALKKVHTLTPTLTHLEPLKSSATKWILMCLNDVYPPTGHSGSFRLRYYLWLSRDQPAPQEPRYILGPPQLTTDTHPRSNVLDWHGFQVPFGGFCTLIRRKTLNRSDGREVVGSPGSRQGLHAAVRRADQYA